MEYLIFIFPFKSNCLRLIVTVVLCTGGNLITVPWCEGSVILFDAKASGKTLWSAADTCFQQTTHPCSAHRTFSSDVSTASGPLTADACEQIEGPGTLVSCSTSLDTPFFHIIFFSILPYNPCKASTCKQCAAP